VGFFISKYRLPPEEEFMEKSVSAVEAQKKLIVALDLPDSRQALAMAELLWHQVGAFKIGMQLFYSQGPTIVQEIRALGGQVFIDLKLHDIPNTVAKAAAALTRQGALMMTLHAAGGFKMMTAAAAAICQEADDCGLPKPLALAVTVLTSLGQEEFSREIGNSKPIARQVVEWAVLARQAGLDGVVCSPWEIESIRKACGRDFLIVTPGVRPHWAAADDQQRIMTPQEAITKGADYLVVGRPITAQPDPAQAAAKIVQEMLI
jgi:orotidine-5'-phosphate decarboxylase